MSNIAIVTFSGIGNLIHWTPCIQALHSMGHKIYLFTWDRCRNILDKWDLLEGISYSMEQNKWPDVFFDYLFVPAVGAYLTPGLSNRCKEIIRQQISVWGKHESEYMMDFAIKIGYNGEMPNPYVDLSQEYYDIVDEFINKNNLNDFIMINASYLKDHNWPLKHPGNVLYNQLIQKINQEMGIRCVLVGSEEDYKDAQEILLGTSCNHNLCGWSKNIQQTISLITASAMVVGNDGGLAHVANALYKPTITFFTFTNPIKNRPFGPNAHMVMLPCDKRITCQHGYWRTCKHRECRNIPIDIVYNKVAQVYQTIRKTNDKII